MTEMPPVGLLSGDLIFGSQLASALQAAGMTVTNTRDQEMVAGRPIVFVDLNSDIDQRLGAIAALRAGDPHCNIVGFCHHGEGELRRRGMAAGASQVIANRYLRQAAVRLATARANGQSPPRDA